MGQNDIRIFYQNWEKHSKVAFDLILLLNILYKEGIQRILQGLLWWIAVL